MLTSYAAFAEPGQRATRPNIARVLRVQNPADYEGEDEAVTIRRLYRLSVAMHNARRHRRVNRALEALLPEEFALFGGLPIDSLGPLVCRENEHR